jgi:hypothetical protein
MHDRQPGKLPPCELSSYCLRLLDDLADLVSSGPDDGFEQVYLDPTGDRQHRRLVAQMRAHLPHCPTCTATLQRALALRSEQRAVLRDYLRDNESAVPPTTTRILQSLRETEQRLPTDSPAISPERVKYQLPELSRQPNTPRVSSGDASYEEGFQPAHTTGPLTPGSTLSPARRWLRNGLTFATIIALIVTAISMFGHYLARPAGSLAGLQTQVAKNDPKMLTQTLTSPVSRSATTIPITSPSSTSPSDANQGWNGLVLITTVGAMYSVISTYNYLNGDHRELAQSSAAMQFDGVGSYGQNMLYQVTEDGQTYFYTLNLLPATGYFYALDGDDALNAIWMPDNQHVLIGTQSSGVIMVDTQTGQSQPFLPDLKTGGLKFYRNGYLYFLGSNNLVAGALYRVNVQSGVVQQVAGRSADGDYWLSPDGLTVYYHGGGPLDRAGIYAASSDGTSSQVIRTDGGMPIGYAPDNSLVVMRHVGQAFEVIQLGATPAQDRTLLSDAAPGATSLCSPSLMIAVICEATNVALAPLSHALVVVASYPDGSRKVWSDDLQTGKQFVLMQPDSNTNVTVPGWDRIAVP